jgi:protein-L-isoaspartate O-methyltransferase
MADDSSAIDNPFFARLWSTLSTHEPESIRRLRRENLAGLSGRVLEVGAGSGTNFAFYPEAVSEVVAVEPERRLAGLASQAAEHARVPVTVTTQTIEHYARDEQFDAVVCSLVLCSVADPDDVLQQLFSMLRRGGELRYLEHVASTGLRAGMQTMADAMIWPRLFGNCHTHRHTEQAITAAGFEVRDVRREWVVPAWIPMPSAETAIGRAVKPTQPKQTGGTRRDGV